MSEIKKYIISRTEEAFFPTGAVAFCYTSNIDELKERVAEAIKHHNLSGSIEDYRADCVDDLPTLGPAPETDRKFPFPIGSRVTNGIGCSGTVKAFADEHSETVVLVDTIDDGQRVPPYFEMWDTEAIQADAPPAANAPAIIGGTIFPDPVAFFREERETIECLDSVSSMYLAGRIEFDTAIAVTVFDEEESESDSKQLTLDDLVEALRKLCELVDAGKLFVGGVRKSHDLTDGCNWDAEVTDAFWQIAYHGEVIYG